MMVSGIYSYWMTNQEWFYYDDETGEPHLTDKAPEEAKESFEKYMELVKKSKETGICY